MCVQVARRSMDIHLGVSRGVQTERKRCRMLGSRKRTSKSSILTENSHSYSRTKRKVSKDILQEGRLYGTITLVLFNEDSGYSMTGIREKQE